MNNKFKNKFLVPVGRDDKAYIDILESHKDHIGGVYIGWPGAPSGRNISTPSWDFFNFVYAWCKKNKKVFDILFNMQSHAFSLGFSKERIDLQAYEKRITELTFASIMFAEEKMFSGHKINVSVNYKTNFSQQIHVLRKELPNLNSIILDRDINRNNKLVNKLVKEASHLGVNIDLLITEGCLPFCPHKVDHNIFITTEHFKGPESDEKRRAAMQICYKFYGEDNSNILRTPFITRENLDKYQCRFFKIAGRELPPEVIDKTLAYYIKGDPIDIGIAFPVVKQKTSITTDMLPASFHEKILNCKNECHKCDYCSKAYDLAASKKGRNKVL
jgi:hypothetical protein